MSAAEKIRVIIVDDIAETRENICKLLTFENDVSVIGLAGTGRRGVEIAERVKPDVVLMDINMPDIDGITATELIRKKVPFAQIVILSVQSDPNYMRRAMLAGAMDFLTKPPSVDELSDSIRRAGLRAYAERNGPVEGAYQTDQENIGLQIKETELSLLEVSSRLEMYNESLISGKLVDKIDLLIAGIAHDVKSPLNIILSIMNSISTKDIDNIEIQKQLRRIWHRCNYCKWLAENFLGVSMIEKPSITTFALREVAQNAIETLASKIPESVKIENDIHLDIKIKSDPGILRTVLMNLIDHAIEKIIENGKITIYTDELSTDELFIRIGDNGPQIDPAIAPNLFNLGWPAKRSKSGASLYVARRLVRQLGGDLTYSYDKRSNCNLFSVTIRKIQVSKANTIFELVQFDTQLAKLSWKLRERRLSELSEDQSRDMNSLFEKFVMDFSHNLGHELGIIESTINKLLNQQPMMANKLQQSFIKIYRNCAYCRLLTTNMLEIVEENLPHFKLISLTNTIQDVLFLVDRKMPPELYRVEWEIDPLLGDIEADETQIKQVFMNLIRNALDAMPSGGTIKFALKHEMDMANIAVSDTGIGISPDKMMNLFTLGYTTKPKGYGIGLYSINNIIHKHGGTINVTSREGRGTTFILRLPYQHVA